MPKTLDALRRSNDYAAELVRRHPTRFGMLAALSTDDPDACLAETSRAADELGADGFAVTCRYNGVYLSDPSLDPVWAELDRRRATVPTNLAAALSMTTLDRIVYGSDCGVPCTTDATMGANLDALFDGCGLTPEQVGTIGHNALNLFPSVARRLTGATEAAPAG